MAFNSWIACWVHVFKGRDEKIEKNLVNQECKSSLVQLNNWQFRCFYFKTNYNIIQSLCYEIILMWWPVFPSFFVLKYVKKYVSFHQRLMHSDETPRADAAKLYRMFVRTKQPGVVGVALTVLLYILLFILSSSILYLYCLR
jgi:hypothetical protein